MKQNYRKLAVLVLTVCLLVSCTSGSAFAAHKVAFGDSQVTVDTFHGVPAYYKNGNHNSDSTYSCAAYVDRYYKTVYGVDPYNLVTGGTPKSAAKGYSFGRVYQGNVKPGDIGYQTNSKGSGHWFIIKTVNGASMTIIEQNWKYQGTATVDRVVAFGSTPGLKVFRLYKNGADANGNTSSAAGTAAAPAASAGSVKNTAALEELLFDRDLYYSLYPDLQKHIGNNASALKNHWNSHGKNEGRIASVFFDPAFYMKANPDVAKAYGASNWRGAYDHFVNYGFWEGRQGSAVFQAKWYIQAQHDIKAAFGNDWVSAARHFKNHGISEYRQASAAYSVSRYASLNSDVRRAFSSPFQYICHYLQYGKYEGRKTV